MTLLLCNISRNYIVEQKTSMLTPLYKILQHISDNGIANKCEVQKVMLGAGGRQDMNSMIIKKGKHTKYSLVVLKRTVASQEQCGGQLYEDICWNLMTVRKSNKIQQ